MGTDTTPTGDFYIRNMDGSWSPFPTKIVEVELFDTTSGECKQDGEC